MGSGAAYTSKCADIVLMDDNFASIVSGSEEGRLMYENLKKCLLYALSSNVPEMAAFLLSMVAQIPQPLGILAVLCIDLGTDLLPAVALAFEEPEENLMLICYEELRKAISRKHPGAWVDRETQY